MASQGGRDVKIANFKVWVEENLTKRSCNTLLRLVRFSVTQTLLSKKTTKRGEGGKKLLILRFWGNIVYGRPLRNQDSKCHLRNVHLRLFMFIYIVLVFE